MIQPLKDTELRQWCLEGYLAYLMAGTKNFLRIRLAVRLVSDRQWPHRVE